MRSRRQALDWFLGALAVAAAARAVLRSTPEPAPAGGRSPEVAGTRKQWAGSLVRTIRREVSDDETVVISAALSFYAMLALVPAMIAAWSLYGLVLDTDSLGDQIDAITDALPASAESLVTDQLIKLEDAQTAGLSLGAVLSLIAALWVASRGTKALLHGINLVYNVEERRPWLLRRALAYGLTVGFVVFAAASVALVTFLPRWLEGLGLGSTGRLVVEVGRWPGIFFMVVLGLAVLYRVAPYRQDVRSPILFPGAAAAAVLWVLATAGFSVYTGSGLSALNETYGVLVQFVVLLLWFFASGFVILLGAEVNASLEDHRRP